MGTLPFRNIALYNNFYPTESNSPATESQPKNVLDTDALDLQSLVNILGMATKSGVIISDRSCRILFSNPLAHKLLDIPVDYFKPGRLSTDVIDFMAKRNDFGADFSANSLNVHIQDIIKNANSGLESRQSWTVTQTSGRVVYFSNVFLKEGYIVFLVTEHTERAQQDTLLAIALKNGNAGYWSMNFKQDKVIFSQHLRSLFTDHEYEKCLKMGFWAVSHPDEVDRVKAVWAEGMATQESFNFTHRVVLEKSGVSYFHTTAKPDYSACGKALGVTCFLSDVTQHHLALNKMRDEKESAQKILQDNNEFLARMSHEIRTPMNGILGMADALLYNGEFEQASEELSVIKDSAINLLRILDSTLEHARLSARKIKIMPDNHDPRILLQTLTTLWQTKAQLNDTSLTLHMDQKLPNTINFDRFRLEQCMNNLLSNAVKFTNNGKIQIVATFVEKPDQPAYFILAVKDNGIGMNADQQSRVFTPFEQADESISLRFGGTGLGMPICKDIVELMGGNITLKSELGQGSTFIISLPCSEFERSTMGAALFAQYTAQDKAKLNQTQIPHIAQQTAMITPTNEMDSPANIAPSGDDAPKLAGDTGEMIQNIMPENVMALEQSDDPLAKYKSLRILVVEDNETNQIVMKALLSPIVDEIFFAANGQDGLDTLASNRVDLVLMDIHMPVMDGIEATLAIRASDTEWSDVGIIALTADPEYQQKRICRNIGMNSAISKPVSRGDLLQAFDEVLGKLGTKTISRLSA